MEAQEAYLPVVALAAGVALLAAEVRRMGRERDRARADFEALVTRLADRPSTVLMQPAAPLSAAQPYISDEPYHDAVWDEFQKANEAPAVVEDAE